MIILSGVVNLMSLYPRKLRSICPNNGFFYLFLLVEERILVLSIFVTEKEERHVVDKELT
jgi:hypothetical protein